MFGISGFFPTLLVNESAQDRFQPFVAARQQHYVGNVNGRAPGMPNRAIPIHLATIEPNDKANGFKKYGEKHQYILSEGL
jgi:hypothetical protein